MPYLAIYRFVLRLDYILGYGCNNDAATVKRQYVHAARDVVLNHSARFRG